MCYDKNTKKIMLFSKNCAVELRMQIFYDKRIEKLFSNRDKKNEMEDSVI